MSKDYQADEVKLPNPQKYSWKKYKIFTLFRDADSTRNALKKEGNLVKIRRCGPRGSQFKVVIGSEIKKNTSRKGRKKNAAE